MEFTDTSVLLYAYDASDPDRHETARSLVSSLVRSRTGALSVQVLQEFSVNAVVKVAGPLIPMQVRDRIRSLAYAAAQADRAVVLAS